MFKNHVISTRNERLTSGFGRRPNPTGAGTEQHNGADFVDAQGLQRAQDVGIIAIADGRVAEVVNGALVGWTVAIAHEGRILSRYQHMKPGSIRVKLGETVRKGDVLGVMGTSGRSTGVHLHFAVREDSTSVNSGAWVDPLPYLRGEKSIGGSPSTMVQPVPTLSTQTTADFKAGDKVRVLRAVQFSGSPFRAWHEIYDVIQVRKDGAVVIGIGAVVTAAVSAADLAKV
jgi:hypothetical protein